MRDSLGTTRIFFVGLSWDVDCSHSRSTYSRNSLEIAASEFLDHTRILTEIQERFSSKCSLGLIMCDRHRSSCSKLPDGKHTICQYALDVGDEREMPHLQRCPSRVCS